MEHPRGRGLGSTIFVQGPKCGALRASSTVHYVNAQMHATAPVPAAFVLQTIFFGACFPDRLPRSDPKPCLGTLWGGGGGGCRTLAFWHEPRHSNARRRKPDTTSRILGLQLRDGGFVFTETMRAPRWALTRLYVWLCFYQKNGQSVPSWWGAGRPDVVSAVVHVHGPCTLLWWHKGIARPDTGQLRST